MLMNLFDPSGHQAHHFVPVNESERCRVMFSKSILQLYLFILVFISVLQACREMNEMKGKLLKQCTLETTVQKAQNKTRFCVQHYITLCSPTSPPQNPST